MTRINLNQFKMTLNCSEMKEMLAIILIFFAPCLLSENHKKLFKYLVDADETDPGFVPTLDSKFLVRYHNKVRREIGSSNMMEVRWEKSLAENAAKWVSKCDCSKKPWYKKMNVTQNVEFATSVKFESFLRDALFHWYNEKENYDEKKGKCKENCDHYTTMMQWNLMQMGCAVGYCSTLETTVGPYEGAVYLTCEYHTVVPNTLTRPYLMQGEPCSQCPRDFYICRAGLCYGIDKRYKEWVPVEEEASCRSPSIISLFLSTLAVLLY